MDYNEWEKSIYQNYYSKKSNKILFNEEYNEHVRLRQRAPLPLGSEVKVPVPVQFGEKTSTMELVLVPQNNAVLGTVSYYVSNANSLRSARLSANAPYLFMPLNNPPRLLIITGFYSHYEDMIKGIGSAMLRELLKVADQAECLYVAVAGGINHPVYEAFGFDLVDDVLETWCIPVSRLRARLSPLRRFHEAP